LGQTYGNRWGRDMDGMAGAPSSVLSPWRWWPSWSLLITYRSSSFFEVIYPLVNFTAR
jgi:hypothetical protein